MLFQQAFPLRYICIYMYVTWKEKGEDYAEIRFQFCLTMFCEPKYKSLLSDSIISLYSTDSTVHYCQIIYCLKSPLTHLHLGIVSVDKKHINFSIFPRFYGRPSLVTAESIQGDKYFMIKAGKITQISVSHCPTSLHRVVSKQKIMGEMQFNFYYTNGMFVIWQTPSLYHNCLLVVRARMIQLMNILSVCVTRHPISVKGKFLTNEKEQTCSYGSISLDRGKQMNCRI